MTQLLIPSQPIAVAPPQGAGTLPIVEIEKKKVKTDGAHIQLKAGSKKRAAADCSYGNFSGSLTFTAWELFHAAKKTELTRTFSPQRAERLGLLFADEHSDHFAWNLPNFRCTDGSGLWLEDFSTTNLAGRIGEAVAYLTMVQPAWGYVYWDRIASVWMRAARNANIQHQEMLQVAKYTGQISQKGPTLQPDFVFERTNDDVALMEAKGSFVTPGNSRPDVKSPLKHGLEQLGKWGHLIVPTPSRSFAICSALREESDSCSDPSLILYVDPPPVRAPDIVPVEFPKDLIRRGNFGSWLAEMGFRSSGRALAERRAAETDAVELPVVSLAGQDYAFNVQGWRINQRRPSLIPWYPFGLMFEPWPHLAHILKHVGINGVYAVGLEVTALRAVSACLKNLNSNALLELQPTLVEFGDQQALDGFYGSVMPDGSMTGVLSTRLFEGDIRMEAFDL
jgi:hypothetical protein